MGRDDAERVSRSAENRSLWSRLRKAVVVLAFPCLAVAQSVEVEGSFGYSQFGLESLDDQLATGAGMRFYPISRLSIEPEFLYLKEGSKFRVRAYMFSPNIGWDFYRRDESVAAYAFGGIGGVWHRINLPPELAGLGTTGSASTVFWGVGVKGFARERFFVSPEFRMGFADEPYIVIAANVGFVLWRKGR